MHVCAQLRGTFRLKISRGGGLEQTLSSEYLRGNWNQPGVKHAYVSISFHHLVTFSRCLSLSRSSFLFPFLATPRPQPPPAVSVASSRLAVSRARHGISPRRGMYARTDNKSWSFSKRSFSREFSKFCDFPNLRATENVEVSDIAITVNTELFWFLWNIHGVLNLRTL